MKKLLIVAAALMTAGIASAATVQWQISAASAAEGADVYLVLTADVPSEITDLSDITDAAFASGTITKSGRNYIAKGTTEVASLDAGSTSGYTYYFIDTASSSYLVGGTGTVAAYGPTDSAIAASNAGNSNYTAPGGAGWTKVQAVPEPTTLALLALGLAAVGLKRKVA